jgi:glutamate 5-kinase
MNIAHRPKSLSGKQACYQFRVSDLVPNYFRCQALAAIGQGRLIALWDNLFGQLEQPIAQILLTRGDISDVCQATAPRKTINHAHDCSAHDI